MILFSFLPIAPPGKKEGSSEILAGTKFSTISWVLIVSGGSLLIYSLFSKSRRKLIYLSVSIVLIALGIIFLIW